MVLRRAGRCLDTHELLIRRRAEHLATSGVGTFEEAGDEGSTTVDCLLGLASLAWARKMLRL
jgi:hypothetical protein